MDSSPSSSTSPGAAKAYRIAQNKIEKARQSGATDLDLTPEFKLLGKEMLAAVPESLSQLTHLQSLKLARNKLRVLPEGLGQLTRLHSLDISDNQLAELPNWRGQFTELRSLNLSNNRLTALPEWVGQFTQLKSLSLSKNKLEALPASLGELTKLQSLNLSHNPLAALPEWVRNLTQLQSLNVSDNQLTTLPEWLSELTTLHSLRVSENNLTELPSWVRHLSQLRSLNLSNNHLTALPDSIMALTELRGLYLNNNRIAALPEGLRCCRLLEDLRVSHNLVTSLPNWIGEFDRLELLEIASNLLEELPDSIGNLTQLRDLYLGLQIAGSGNPLGKISECVRSLSQLRVFWFQGCGLKSLPKWLSELADLENIYVGHNELSDLPETIANLVHLRRLDLEGNPLNPDLAAAYKEGHEAVKRYLREMGKGARNRYEAKLLILGDGNEGKTCVSRALRGLPFRAQKTTRGVDVVRWTFPHPDDAAAADKEITLNIWDFEGQEISHQTHQFFLTSQSLYLLVFKCRDQFLMDRAEYWMDTIRARAPLAKVVIVISQCEERSPHVPIDKIEAQYSNMLAKEWFFTVGCENGRNIDGLRGFLRRSAAHSDFMGSLWPKSYDKAEQQIKSKAKTKMAHISRAKLNGIFVKAGVSIDNYEGAAAAMSRLGVITQFPDCADLRDFVVLKPQWLTKAISKVMEDSKLSEYKGEITLKRMEAIWNKSRFPGMFATFHDCMKEFELCYDLEDQSRSCLVPLRFGYVAPPIPWSNDEGMKERRMQYKLNIRPPMGIMSRFIVKTHHMIVTTTEHPSGIYWHNGVFLRSMSPVPSEALCEFVPDEGTFHVRVRAAFPQNMCEQLHGYLQALFSFFGGLKAERSYGCIKVDQQTGKEQQCSGLHTEKRIYAAISKNRETLDCEFESHEVDPRLLVGGFSSFNDFVIERIAVVMRQEMDKPPEWAAPFLRGMSALLDWVTSNSDKLDQVLWGQTALAAEFKQEAELKLHEYLNCMSAMLDDRDHTAAPGLISIMTKDRSPWNLAGFFQQTYVLMPYCECEGNIHSCEDGRVEFTKDKAWWKKTAPWIARGTKLLTAGLQLAFAGMPLALGAEAAKAVEDEVKLMDELTKHLELEIPDDEGDDGSVKIIEGATGKDLRGNDHETARTRAGLARFLEETAPDNYRARRWGSLRRVRMPDNSYRWLCEAHKA